MLHLFETDAQNMTSIMSVLIFVTLSFIWLGCQGGEWETARGEQCIDRCGSGMPAQFHQGSSIQQSRVG